MEYYFVLLLVAAVSGGTLRVQPITTSYQYSPYVYHQHAPLQYISQVSTPAAGKPVVLGAPPAAYQYSPYIYQHAPAAVQVISQLPAAVEGKTVVVGAHPGVNVVAAAPIAAPVLASVKSSILTDEDKQSTTLVENAPAHPVVQVLNTPFYHILSAVQKPVEAEVQAVEPVVQKIANIEEPVATDVVHTPVAPAPFAPGYFAITPGSIHEAPLPVGPSGDGLSSSHHVNLADDIHTTLSRNRRSPHQVLISQAHHVPALTNIAPVHTIPYTYPQVYHTAAYPQAYHTASYPQVYHSAAYPFYNGAIDTPFLKTVPVKSVVAPVTGNQVVSQVVNTPVAAPGYVAITPGATHTAPLPVGPSGDSFYASHHVNLK